MTGLEDFGCGVGFMIILKKNLHPRCRSMSALLNAWPGRIGGTVKNPKKVLCFLCFVRFIQQNTHADMPHTNQLSCELRVHISHKSLMIITWFWPWNMWTVRESHVKTFHAYSRLIHASRDIHVRHLSVKATKAKDITTL